MKKLKEYFKKIFIKRGFTLVELLIVIFIIGLLGSVIVVNLSSAREKARDSYRLASLNQVEKAIELYKNDNNGEPPGIEGVEYVNGVTDWIPGLVPDYIPELPSDPINSMAHKFHYFRHGYDYGVMTFLERSTNTEGCEDDNSCQYAEVTSGDSLEITNPGESDWRFTDSTEIVYMTCPNINEQVTICHRLHEDFAGVTLTVSCEALGPAGHSNHPYDTLGACTEEIADPSTIQITATASTGGTISPSGATEVTAGASASFTISANSGYERSSLIIDGVSEEPNSTYTFSNIQTSHTISATFSLLTVEVPDYHSFSITSGPNGTITSDSTSVIRGEDITFSITPDIGYEVASFSIDGTIVGTPTTYTFTDVTADHTINATFSAVVTEPACAVTITPTLTTYISGRPAPFTWDSTCYSSSNVMLEVRKMTDSGSTSFIMIYSSAPNTGSYPYPGFPTGTIGSDRWVLRVTDYNQRTIYNESSQFMVETAPSYTITATAGANGTISPSTASILEGSNSTFIISANSGYQVESVTVDGASVGTSTTYTFTDVTANHTISATFSTSTAEPECLVTLTPALTTYTSGTPVQLTWDTSCYPSSRVILEVRKMTDSGSTSYIMIYSSASNTGTYPYQGFPGATIGSENWVVRVTNDSPRTILNESSEFTVAAATPTSSHTITATAGTNGTISPSTVSVTEGSNSTFTISANTGYQVESVTVDGTNVGTSTAYTFTNVTADHTISATFQTIETVENLGDLTIHGRFIDAFTNAPLSDIVIKTIIPPSPFYSTLMNSDTNGEFTFTLTTTDIEPTEHKQFTYYGVSCYMSGVESGLAVITKNTDSSLRLGRNPFDLIARGSLYIDPITTSNINLGDIPLWPAKTIIINSDIPVQFKIEIPEEAISQGNTLYKTAHKLNFVVPLDYDTVVKLTDNVGNIYLSPAHRFDREAGCSDAILNFESGQFTWE